MGKKQIDLFKVPKVDIVKGRIQFVLERCKGKKVLHVGCVDEGVTVERIRNGALMHLQLMKAAKEVCGLDISKKGIKLLEEEGISNLFWGDAEHLDSVKDLQGKDFDIILAAEMIEHLDNPGLFLQSAKFLFAPDTKMILTTPNAFRFTQIPYSIKGYEFVHPDHNYWFSWKTLSTLLMKNGYVVNEVVTYTYVDYKIRSMLKSMFRLNMKRTLGIFIRNRLYKRNPFLADGFIYIVRPEEIV